MGEAERQPNLAARLWTRNCAGMLARNTAVSFVAFGFDLLLLWLLVEYGGMQYLWAAALAFVAANTLHYGLGRAWVFAGTERGITAGYVYFLINACVGLTITLSLLAFFVEVVGIHYIVARTLASVFAGLAVFLLNAVLNFRKL